MGRFRSIARQSARLGTVDLAEILELYAKALREITTCPEYIYDLFKGRCSYAVRRLILKANYLTEDQHPLLTGKQINTTTQGARMLSTL